MKFSGVKSFLSLAVVLAALAPGFAEVPATGVAVDPTLLPYERVLKLDGNLKLVGSNTMSHLAGVWGDHFRRMYPDVKIDIYVEGAINAVDAVIDGKAHMGLLSRDITEAEVRRFHEKFGYLPTVLTGGLEAQVIFVHKDNPIESISLSQLDAIFSTSLKRGEAKTFKTWGDLGVEGEWANRPIVTHGRRAATGSQVFLQSAILGGGEFRTDMVSHESNADLIAGVAGSLGGIGFCGSSHESNDVKMVPVSLRTGDPSVDPRAANYPLVRRLQLVLNNNPEGGNAPLQTEFIKYVFSRSGQQDVLISGFLPVPSAAANISLQAIGEKTLN